MPRRADSPPIITVKVDGVVTNFNGLHELPLEKKIFLGNDLSVLQVDVMFSGSGVLS